MSVAWGLSKVKVGLLLTALPACSSELAAPSAGLEPATALLVKETRSESVPVNGRAGDYDELLARIGDADVVLLGEATHGTHEFYEARSRITQRLISEKGFDAVMVEIDWPEALPINRYVRGEGEGSGRDVLEELEGFPTWMWRNEEVLELVEWLRRYNTGRPGEQQIGFYGIDLQTFAPGMEEVVSFLEPVAGQRASKARERYECLTRFPGPQEYAQAVEQSGQPDCAAQLSAQVEELEERAAELSTGGREEGYFGALQTALMLVRAEQYFRGMYRGMNTWNFRDTWMADVVGATRDRQGGGKVVVWAHNSHVGDARATEVSQRGELNLGQLARQRWGSSAFLVGFTTYQGTVVAADYWDGHPQTKQVRPALEGSIEDVFHQTGEPSFLLPIRGSDNGPFLELLREPRLERAIGVIYLPQTERQSHYFDVKLADQFDAVIHFDQTSGVDPLDE